MRLFDTEVGEKYQSESGELLHVITVEEGKIEARVNGTGFILRADCQKALMGWSVIRGTKLTDQQYQVKLDAFWNARDDQDGRVEPAIKRAAWVWDSSIDDWKVADA